MGGLIFRMKREGEACMVDVLDSLIQVVWS